jgi:hypothetical protein
VSEKIIYAEVSMKHLLVREFNCVVAADQLEYVCTYSCVVLCRVVLCCIVSCRVVSCCVVLCCVVSCRVVLCCVVLCFVVM